MLSVLFLSNKPRVSVSGRVEQEPLTSGIKLLNCDLPDRKGGLEAKIVT